jgi:hypothetical protein
MMFVNELVEIFIDYRDSSKDIWNRWGSNGDGLSQFCGILRFQQAHYLAYNPFGTNWLTSSYRHPNWVDHVESTGGINTGFGCALMFLFYVKDQLGFSSSETIQNSGKSLAKRALAFSKHLVGLMFPYGAAIDPALSEATKDNPVPIYLQLRVRYQYQSLPRAPQQIEFLFDTNSGDAVLAVFAGFHQTRDLTSTSLSIYLQSQLTGNLYRH